MNTTTQNETSRRPGWPTQLPCETGTKPGGALNLVKLQEAQSLREALQGGTLPSDLETKLVRLSGSGLGRDFIERNSRLFISLLRAAQVGLFRDVTAVAHERLLHVLAYVRKDDDAIPDSRPDGFLDDLHEVRTACLELAPTLAEFKRWHLQHQVPQLWLQRHQTSKLA